MLKVNRALVADLCSRGDLIPTLMAVPLGLSLLWYGLFMLTDINLGSSFITFAIARLISCNVYFIAILFFNIAQIQPRQYLLPLTTRQLLRQNLVVATVISVLVSVATSLLQNWLFQRQFSILTPALVGIVSGSCMLAVACLTKGSTWKWVVPLFVGLLLSAWYLYRIVLVPLERIYSPMTSTDFGFLAGLFAISIWILTYAVERNRCGEVLKPIPLPTGLRNHWDSALAGRKHHSKDEALFWFQAQQTGPYLAQIAIGLTIVIVVCSYITNKNLNQLLIGYTKSWFVVGPTLGWIVGVRVVSVFAKFESRRMNLSCFLTAMPITNSQLAHVVFKLIGLNGLYLIGIWFITLIFIFFAAHKDSLFSVGELSADFRWWQIPAAALLYWVCAANFSTLILANNRLISYGLVATYVVGNFGMLILVGNKLPADLKQQIIQAVLYGLCFAAIALMFASLWKACRDDLIPTARGMLCVLGWCTLSVLLLLGWESAPEDKISLVPLGIGIAALTFAPIAMTPIAISGVRSR